MNKKHSEQRIAIVTGGGGGIGQAICRHLAEEGMLVVVTDINLAAAQRVREELGSSHIALEVDVTDEQSIKSLFDHVELHYGPVAVVVAAAGLLIMPNGERPLIHSMDLDVWDRSFDVNTRGAFLCSREFLRRRMEKPTEHCRMVFFSSVAAQLGGYRSSSAYIAAKSALLGYAKAFAREAAPYQITSNTIAPGLIATEMLHSTVQSNGALEEAAKNIPLQRIGSADDVAYAVRYLTSIGASYITGNVIDVNGGYRMQ